MSVRPEGMVPTSGVPLESEGARRGDFGWHPADTRSTGEHAKKIQEMSLTGFLG